jgi:RHS repeat-associated protein
LTSADGVGYTYDDNGNLLTTGVQTNTWDAANRLIETTRTGTTLQPLYDGLGNRVGQTVGLSTTTFALDVQGLPEVIYTSERNAYLHLPGVIVVENGAGERRYSLSDGLGSVRQASDETGAVVAYHAFDPYGNPVADRGEPYGYTGEWWEDEVGLLYLRARWYRPETGSFVSRDPVEGEPTYLYVRGNPVNRVDPSGMTPPPPNVPPTPTPCPDKLCKVEVFSVAVGGTPIGRHLFIIHTDENATERTFQAYPESVPPDVAQEFKDHWEHDRSASPDDSPWGQLIVDSYPGFDRGSLQGRDTPGLRGPKLIIVGEKACPLHRCLENVKRAINDAQLSYWPHDQNSNAAAATMLKIAFCPVSDLGEYILVGS